jgi:hypothetical protein
MRSLFLTATLLMALCTSVKAAVLFEDDFASLTGVWSGVDGTFAITNGAYSLSGGTDTRVVAFAGITSWQDYSFGADFNLAAGFQPSILFHVQDFAAGTDHGHYYQFNVATNGQADFYEINSPGTGTVHLKQVSTAGYSLNSTHHLSVTIQGQTATGYFDGAPILTYSGFTNYTYGGIGLKSFKSSTLFDNMVVMDTNAPPPQPDVSINRAVEGVNINWLALNNATYQMQWVSDITSTNWTNLGLFITGAGINISVFDYTTNNPERFYRVLRFQ